MQLRLRYSSVLTWKQFLEKKRFGDIFTFSFMPVKKLGVEYTVLSMQPYDRKNYIINQPITRLLRTFVLLQFPNRHFHGMKSVL